MDVLAALEELNRIHKTNTAQVLAFRTGGTLLPFTRQSGLEQALEKLGGELHRQYVLSYTPDHVAAGYHRVDVQLKRAGEWTLRARPGYWSGEAPVETKSEPEPGLRP